MGQVFAMMLSFYNVEEGSRFEDLHLYFVPTSLLHQLKLLYQHSSFGTLEFFNGVEVIAILKFLCFSFPFSR